MCLYLNWSRDKTRNYYIAISIKIDHLLGVIKKKL
jgi:hypothetical protein